jgi:hypothetical protein
MMALRTRGSKNVGSRAAKIGLGSLMLLMLVTSTAQAQEYWGRERGKLVTHQMTYRILDQNPNSMQLRDIKYVLQQRIAPLVRGDVDVQVVGEEKVLVTYQVPESRLADLEPRIVRVCESVGALEIRLFAERSEEDPAKLKGCGSAEGGEEVKAYLDRLEKSGPASRPGDKFLWKPVHSAESLVKVQALDGRTRAEDGTDALVLAKHEGKHYALVHADLDCSLQPYETDPKRKWELIASNGARNASTGLFVINFSLGPRGAEMLSEVTKANLGRRLAIIVDDVLIAQAMITTEVGPRAQFGGGFTREEVMLLSRIIKFEKLPLHLKLASVETAAGTQQPSSSAPQAPFSPGPRNAPSASPGSSPAPSATPGATPSAGNRPSSSDKPDPNEEPNSSPIPPVEDPPA